MKLQNFVHAFLPSAVIFTIRPLQGGDVNKVWLVKADNKTFVLKRMHGAFDERAILDAHHVTTELVNRGWEQPRNCMSISGEPYYIDDNQARTVWSLSSFIASDGCVPKGLAQPYGLYGQLLGRLHGDLAASSYVPKFVLPHYRDTEYHLAKLDVLQSKLPTASVRRVATTILKEYGILPDAQPTREQLIHGDPRTANMLFRGAQPFTIIDWDGLMYGTVWMDIGDLLRSLIEDSIRHGYSLGTNEIKHVCRGYYGINQVDLEWSSFIRAAHVATRRISLELAARFANDIVEDCYWSWDSTQYDSRAASNSARANEALKVALFCKRLSNNGGINNEN